MVIGKEEGRMAGRTIESVTEEGVSVVEVRGNDVMGKDVIGKAVMGEEEREGSVGGQSKF